MKWESIYRGETEILGNETRAAVQGCFVKLTDGFTHYELSRTTEGRTAVLVHGFSVPYFIWDPTFNALTSQGWRVLRYDLFGRGYSDRPNLAYNIDLFVQQLGELLDALNLQKINLIGLSMGGAIAAAFTVSCPDRINKLVLIDPIGTASMPLNLMYRAATLPGISEALLGLAGNEKMVKNIAWDFYDPSSVERFQDQYRVQMQYRGFKHAILSSLRNKMVDGFPETYEQLGKLDTSVLLLWGRNDTTLPLSQCQSLLRLLPRAEFHVIENAGHIPHYERPETVNPLLIHFLS